MTTATEKDYVIILVTTPNINEAKKIAEALLNRKEAACINIINNISSFFIWKTKLDKACETLLIIKSRKSLFAKIESTVKKYHSYTVPEIIALPVMAGSKSYLNWIKEVTEE